MTKKNKTDKEILVKGFKIMGLCLMLMFIGPSLVHLALDNEDKPLYIPLLLIAIILCLSAIIFLFVGIKMIVDSLFNKN